MRRRCPSPSPMATDLRCGRGRFYFAHSPPSRRPGRTLRRRSRLRDFSGDDGTGACGLQFWIRLQAETVPGRRGSTATAWRSGRGPAWQPALHPVLPNKRCAPSHGRRRATFGVPRRSALNKHPAGTGVPPAEGLPRAFPTIPRIGQSNNTRRDRSALRRVACATTIAVSLRESRRYARSGKTELIVPTWRRVRTQALVQRTTVPGGSWPQAHCACALAAAPRRRFWVNPAPKNRMSACRRWNLL